MVTRIWDAVAALVPGRTRSQCLSRWKNVLNPNIDRASGRTGKWTAVEVIKLKAAVQMHGGKDWAVIATLVPGRTRGQCWSRWKDAVDPNNERVTGRPGKWTAVEDRKLKEAVQAQFPRWSRVEREFSAREDGIIYWMPTQNGHLDVRVHGQQTKSSS
jgi:hypothetical protein